MAKGMNHPLFHLLRTLDVSGYHYVLSRNRPDTVTVLVTFVNERVEIEIFEDGHMEVSRFPGSEDIVGGAELIFDLLKKNEVMDR
jgi:hypothetical protein